MYTVLIVDDEPIVREGLEFIIDWNDFGFTIIDNAENGRIGLEKIRSLKPDLVITDIRMPGIDGIEMLKQARAEKNDTHFIILSGYSDFTYAREAMSLDVVSYLLKPIEEAELIEEVLKIKEKLNEKESFMASLTNYREYEVSSKIKKYLLNSNHDNLIELKSFLTSDTFLLIGCMYNPETINRYELDNVLPIPNDLRHHKFGHENILYLLISSDLSPDFDDYIQNLTNFIKLNNKNLVLIQSQEVYSVEGLKKAYNQIQQLKEKSFLYPKEYILSPKLLKSNNEIDISKHLKKVKVELSKTIEENKRSLISELVFSFLDIYQKSNWTAEKIKADLTGVYLNCVQVYEKYEEVPLSENEKNEVISNLLKSDSLIELLKYLEKKLILLTDSFNQSLDTEDIVSRIKRYTKENFDKELSMTELATYFNYSHSYLGKKFRLDTGKSYYTYLNEIRIEEAKKLLRDSSLYIYEISEKVGFSNTDYFHKKFKENVGESPKQYRDKVTGGV